MSPLAATDYALAIVRSKGLSLTPQDGEKVARATAGHPLLITNIVAQARRRDRQALLEEVRRHEGDWAAQVEAVYAWSAERIGEPGRRAWEALPLFPAGWVPEAPLRALAGPEGAEALRDAAVADFDPRLQGWRWHPTAAEYAVRRWPLGEKERQERLAATLPAWAGWLERLRGEGTAVPARPEAGLPNLEALLEVTPQAPREVAWGFLEALGRALPAPDRTLALPACREAQACRHPARRASCPTPTPTATPCLPGTLPIRLTLAPPEVVAEFTIWITGTAQTACAPPVRLEWAWGDGQEDVQPFPARHTYTGPGTYPITATAYDALGNRAVRPLILDRLTVSSSPGDLPFLGVASDLGAWCIFFVPVRKPGGRPGKPAPT